MDLFTIVPIFIVGVFAFIIIKGIAEWMHNNAQPVESVPSRVVAKWTTTSGGDNTSTTTHYHASFEMPSGEHKEFRLRLQFYKLFSEGDSGMLTYQGTRFHEFQRNP